MSSPWGWGYPVHDSRKQLVGSDLQAPVNHVKEDIDVPVTLLYTPWALALLKGSHNTKEAIFDREQMIVNQLCAVIFLFLTEARACQFHHTREVRAHVTSRAQCGRFSCRPQPGGSTHQRHSKDVKHVGLSTENSSQCEELTVQQT